MLAQGTVGLMVLVAWTLVQLGRGQEHERLRTSLEADTI